MRYFDNKPKNILLTKFQMKKIYSKAIFNTFMV